MTGEVRVRLERVPVVRRRPSFAVSSEEESRDRWMLTYCDLVTLLMAIFFVGYAFSAHKPVPPPAPSPPIHRGGDPFATLNCAVTGLLRQADLGRYATVIHERDSLRLRLKSPMLFRSGRADLEPRMRRVLDALAPLLAGIPNRIRIEGHTDDVPIQTEAFPSNWHLSAARSFAIVHYLITRHGIDERRFVPLGFGDTQPLVPGTSKEARDFNRRVDIVIERGPPQ